MPWPCCVRCASWIALEAWIGLIIGADVLLAFGHAGKNGVKIDHVMFLGHVSKYAGGDFMLDTARKALQEEFPAWP